MILGLWRIAEDIIGNAAIVDDIGTLLHFHRYHRGHRFNALDINLRQLLDEGQDRVQFALEMRDLCFPDRNPRQMRDTANGGGID